MTDDQVLKMIADIGPNAKDAVESWVALQWFSSIAGYGLTLFILIMIGKGACTLFERWVNSGDPEEEKSRLRELEKELKDLNESKY